MKTKRLLAFVLPALFAVLLIAGFSTVGAKAANGYVDVEHHCICGSKTDTHLPGCDGTVQTWTGTATIPSSSGYYYLTADVTVSSTKTLGGNLSLDLNGHTISSTAATGVYLISVNPYTLTLLDSAGGGSIVTTSSAITRGGIVHMANGGAKVLTIYGGTYDASGATVNSSETNINVAGLIRAVNTGAGTCTVNIHGGTLIGGTSAKAKHSGGIGLGNGSTLNMTGGILENGTAVHGGNIFADTGSVINLSGGIIRGGSGSSTAGSGGNIAIFGTMTMTGGSIYGGQAQAGGNVKVTAEATLTMSGGEIFAGLCSKEADAGGNIDITSGGSVALSGTAKVYDGYIKNGATASNIYGTVSGSTAENTYFTTHCVCGSTTSTHLGDCDGTAVAWTPWLETTTLPNTAGNYYLADEVTLTTTVDISSNAVINMDLNGHTVSSALRVYNLARGAVVTLTYSDTVGTGLVEMTTYTGGGTFSAIGGNGSKTLTIYGGTFDCSTITASGGNGGFVRATVAKDTYTSTINIHGGEIIGATMSNNKFGGAIYLDKAGCTLNVTGGEIHGGVNPTHGGNIYLNTGSVMTMSGGKIYGGRTAQGQGSNVKLTGATMTMTGGEIYDGWASESSGGNISATEGATLSISGGKIYDGRANSRGGNIYVSTDGTTATISLPAEIYDGYASIEGQNIYVNSGSVTKDDGCFYFTKWDHADFGGSIRLNDSIAVLFYVQNIEEYPARYHVNYEFNGESASAGCTSASSNSFVVADCTAAQMAEEVVITVEYGDENVKDVIFTKTYSIKDYCDGQIANSEASAELKALCRAVLTYGAATQLYNNINTDNLPTATNAAVDLSDRAANGITLADSDNVYNSAVTGNAIVDASANLVLMSKPEFLFKFTALSGVNASGLTINVTKGGAAVAAEDLEITTSGNVVKVQVKNLNPASLRDVYTVTVSDGANSREITYSAMTYIYRKQSTADAALDTACRALQYYFVKAAAYVASQN